MSSRTPGTVTAGQMDELIMDRKIHHLFILLDFMLKLCLMDYREELVATIEDSATSSVHVIITIKL